MLTNYDISRGFVKEEDIQTILNKYSEHAEVERVSCIPQNRKNVEKDLRVQLALKLKLAFSRQIVLSFVEAYQYYNAYPNELQELINRLYDIIDITNTGMNITYIPDKLTICSYFRVSAETFDKLLEDAQVDPQVQTMFQTVNEFILSTAQIGLENGVLGQYTWNRLRLKTQYGGHAIEVHNEEKTPNVIIASTDIKRKLASDYDFTKMIESADSKENK